MVHFQILHLLSRNVKAELFIAIGIGAAKEAQISHLVSGYFKVDFCVVMHEQVQNIYIYTQTTCKAHIPPETAFEERI